MNERVVKEEWDGRWERKSMGIEEERGRWEGNEGKSVYSPPKRDEIGILGKNINKYM
jgi:hypothetical protein